MEAEKFLPLGTIVRAKGSVKKMEYKRRHREWCTYYGDNQGG